MYGWESPWLHRIIPNTFFNMFWVSGFDGVLYSERIILVKSNLYTLVSYGLRVKLKNRMPNFE
jgi:hypothetical protein